MKQKRILALALMWSAFDLVALPTGMSCAYAEGSDAKPAETVSAEVGTPLKAAQELFRQNKFPEALDKLNAIPSARQSPFEDYVIKRTRAAIATTMGDDNLALPAYLSVVATGKLPADEQLKFEKAIGNLYFRKSDYAQAAVWMERFFKEGGTDATLHGFLARSYYLSDDFAHAAQVLQLDLDAAEKAGTAPTEEQLRLLINLSLKQNDKAGYVAALEKMVACHPRKQYWAQLLSRLNAREDFSSHMALDLYRLKFSIGLLTDASDYIDMAQLSMLAGFPAEAKKVMDAGYQAGVLGVGPDSEKQKSLLNAVTRMSVEDSKSMSKAPADGHKTKDGIVLSNMGYAYVTQDQFDTGLDLMEQGEKQVENTPGLKRLDEAKLHLGVAYAMAGRTQQAIEAFKSVHGDDGSADLARYWVLQLTHPTS